MHRLLYKYYLFSIESDIDKYHLILDSIFTEYFFLSRSDKKDTEDNHDGAEDAADRPGRPSIASVLCRLSPIS